MFAKLNRLLAHVSRAPRHGDPWRPYGRNRIRLVRLRWSGIYLQTVLAESRFTLGVNCFLDPFFDIERFAGQRVTYVSYGGLNDG